MTNEAMPEAASMPIGSGGSLPSADSPAAVEITSTNETAMATTPVRDLHAENLALAERLRKALLATDAAISPELLTGETVSEIEASYAAAKALADRVRESVRRESLAAGASTVPAGAPGRSQSRPLNAREKIRAGLSRPAGSAGSAP